MRLEDGPFAGSIYRARAEDRVFGWLMVLGPAVFAVIAVLGRTPVTATLAGLYVAAFVAYIPYKAVAGRDGESRRP